ncbi:MAG TPA: MoxR family ATPase [Candidatus Hungatella pullicola]|nr:MoxR family ATPase [Candidatus Hungatella pullicola]
MEDRESILLKIRSNMEQVIVGKRGVTDLLLCALLAEGHVLLEDVPGTGKTLMAKTFSKTMDLEFSRIQFTPDLLPSDITGLNYFNQKEGEFVLRKGPVFTNILLADEINRATPRTQSSLLEAMEERQVTIDGVTYQLDQPFLVIATENPIETGGTYPLPEAQLDRFFMRISMGLPDKKEELEILNRFQKSNPYEKLKPVCSREEILSLQTQCREIYVSPVLMDYLVSLVQATRTNSQILSGVSPRGSLALLRASMALALIRGREYVVPEDIKELAVPVLAHRLVCARTIDGSRRTAAVMEQILNSVPVPTEEWN